MPYQPKYLVLHDYGKTPVGWKPGTDLGFNPYHALVHGGRVQYRDPQNPYARPAPHAFKLNPQSIGLSWAGPVGGTPDEKDLAAIKAEIARIKQQFPGIKIMSHGEAYAQRGQIPQASKHGRGMNEAAWRTALGLDGPPPAVASGPAGPVAATGPAAPPAAAGSFRAAQEQGMDPGTQAMAAALTGPPAKDPMIAALLDQWTYGTK